MLMRDVPAGYSGRGVAGTREGEEEEREREGDRRMGAHDVFYVNLYTGCRSFAVIQEENRPRPRGLFHEPTVR